MRQSDNPSTDQIVDEIDFASRSRLALVACGTEMHGVAGMHRENSGVFDKNTFDRTAEDHVERKSILRFDQSVSNFGEHDG